MRGGRLKNIFISFFCTIAYLAGALFVSTFTGAGLSFAANEESEADDKEYVPSKDVDKPHITIATWYSDYNLTYFKAFLAKAFPNYEIEFEYVDKSNYEPIMDAKLSCGDAPDIIYVDREMATKHAATGYFEDVTDICDGFNNFARNSFMYGNCIYAVPSTSEFECIYYNKKMFEENNVRVPYSFDTYIECCEKLIDKRGVKPLTISLKSPYTLADLVLATVAADYLSTDRGKGFGGRLQYGRTSFLDELEPFLKDFQKLLDHDILTKEMYVVDAMTAIDEFTDSKAAMIIGGPETYNAIISINPSMDIGTMPFFGEEGRAVIGGGDAGFALNKRSQYKDQARGVLKALATLQGQTALWHDRPGSQTYLKNVFFENEKTFDGIEEMIRQGQTYTPWMDWGKDLNKAAYYQLGREFQRVLLGRQDIGAALKNVDRKVIEILHTN